MAGPGFTILLRAPLTDTQLNALDTWLRTFTVNLEAHRNTAGAYDEWYFRVNDASKLGLPDKPRACMIGLALVEPSREWSGDREEQTMIRLGFWPRYGMNVYAMCKNFPTGRVASYFILQLIERYGGYLGLGMSEKATGKRSFGTEKRQPEPSLPGKSYTIRYWEPDPHPQDAFYSSSWWETEVIDGERLRWWLQDENNVLPGFRMD